MDELKIVGALATWGGVTLAQVNLLVQIAVGLVTFAYILTKLVKILKKEQQ